MLNLAPSPAEPIKEPSAALLNDPHFQNLLGKYGVMAVPRYTSYPTAPHFALTKSDMMVKNWLEVLPTGEAVSVYIHIPFCREICWYCGCNMKLVKRDEMVSDYVDQLLKEIALAATYLPKGLKLGHLHFGGGSPSTLSGKCLNRIMQALHQLFSFEPDAEIAAEIDPRTLRPDFITALKENGFNRVSLGIQEFDNAVQAQINRIQPVELVERVVNDIRAAGIAHVNFDVLYGLPDQTTSGLMRTIDACLAMKPDRFALFGYAHVPWMAKRQRKIKEERLPGLMARADQAIQAGDRLLTAGYQQIGLDHFALRSDPMAIAQANGTLKRNFQGYTADKTRTLIGFGSTAIADTPSGYYQNQPEVTTWGRMIEEDHLPIAKICPIDQEDKARRAIIEDLMCLRPVTIEAHLQAYGQPVSLLEETVSGLSDLQADGLLRVEENTISVTPLGRFFVRVIASRFDTYLRSARHSVAV